MLCWIFTLGGLLIMTGQYGKLAIFREQKVKSGITSQPGQITFLPLPFTFIQRLLYPLVKY